MLKPVAIVLLLSAFISVSAKNKLNSSYATLYGSLETLAGIEHIAQCGISMPTVRTISNISGSVAFSQLLRKGSFTPGERFPAVVHLQPSNGLRNNAFSITEYRIAPSASVVSDMVEIETSSVLRKRDQFNTHNILWKSVLSSLPVNSEKIQMNNPNFATRVYYIHTNLPDPKTLKFILSS